MLVIARLGEGKGVGRSLEETLTGLESYSSRGHASEDLGALTIIVSCASEGTLLIETL